MEMKFVMNSAFWSKSRHMEIAVRKVCDQNMFKPACFATDTS